MKVAPHNIDRRTLAMLCNATDDLQVALARDEMADALAKLELLTTGPAVDTAARLNDALAHLPEPANPLATYAGYSLTLVESAVYDEPPYTAMLSGLYAHVAITGPDELERHAVLRWNKVAGAWCLPYEEVPLDPDAVTSDYVGIAVVIHDTWDGPDEQPELGDVVAAHRR